MLGATGVEASEVAGVGEEPVRLDLSGETSLIYNTDNRNTRPAAVGSVLDDNWGVWFNRLNLQASSGRWRAGLRMDTAWFYSAPTPVEAGLELLRLRAGSSPAAVTEDDGAFFVTKVLEADRELSTRYINWLYPAKYYLAYDTQALEVTVGDFYAQFGRGLVLSVRKADELSSDTTLRGSRLTARVKEGPLQLKLTGVGGSMNPLRLDPSSGRYLGVNGSVTPGFFAATEALMPRAIDSFSVPQLMPGYAPDALVGAQIEVSHKEFQFAVQGSLLDRQRALTADIVRTADTLRTGSVSLNVPTLGKHVALYVEGAGQQLQHSQAPDTDLEGHALYGALTLLLAPVNVTVEGKSFRRFFPLLGNVDLARAPEFGSVQYSAPPTTEAFWVDTEFNGFGSCVTGGRAKADVQVGKNESVFAWLGRYSSWAESVANERCHVADSNLNRVWDMAVGLEIASQRRRSRAQATVGARIDDTDRELSVAGGGTSGTSGTTQIFYRESYVRYEVSRWLARDWSLSLQGWYRRRYQAFGGPGDAYYQGTQSSGIAWSKLTLAFGFDYDTDPRTPDTYFNGQLTYRLAADSSLSLFAGQRRGGLQCVAGVCRVQGPFEGARLDISTRL